MNRLWIVYICAGICVLSVYYLEKNLERRVTTTESNVLALENLLYNMQ